MRLLSIDNAVRRNTSSTDFFFEIFRDDEVVIDYDNQYHDLLARTSFDVVVFWQALPDLKDIPLFRAHNTVLIPMFDQVRDAPDSLWFEFRDFRFLSFSETLHRKLKAWSFDSQLIRYFPAPAVSVLEEKKDSCVFWARSPVPNLETFRAVMGNQPVDTLFLRREGRLEEAGRRELPVSQVVEFHQTENRNEYLAILSQAKFLFASRLYEGIGLSFLEAMARGVCVVAADLPTMNEYIVHGSNGFLYDPQSPATLEAIDFAAVHRNLVEFSSRSHREYLESIPLIREFLIRKSSRYPFSLVVKHGLLGLGLIAVVRRVKWLVSSILRKRR